MQVLLAENDCARGAQTAHHFGILGGNAVLEERAGGGGGSAGGVDNIFQGEGNSMQRAPVAAAKYLVLGAARLVERGLGQNRDESVQAGIELFDADEAIAGQFDGRDSAGANFST